MQIHTFYFNPIRVNTYIIHDEADGNAIIVDAGCYSQEERQRLYDFISRNKLRPVAHLLTHGHLDHIFGARYVFDQWGLLPYLHEADGILYQNLPTQCAFFGIPFNDKTLQEYIPIKDKHLDFDFVTVDVIPTPGHTEGGVSYLVKSKKDNQEVLFTGDTLFCCGMGRTDLPGGNFSKLIHSLQNQLFTLDASLNVYPGHGYTTTIGAERGRE